MSTLVCAVVTLHYIRNTVVMKNLWYAPKKDSNYITIGTTIITAESNVDKGI